MQLIKICDLDASSLISAYFQIFSEVIQYQHTYMGIGSMGFVEEKKILNKMFPILISEHFGHWHKLHNKHMTPKSVLYPICCIVNFKVMSQWQMYGTSDEEF